MSSTKQTKSANLSVSHHKNGATGLSDARKCVLMAALVVITIIHLVLWPFALWCLWFGNRQILRCLIVGCTFVMLTWVYEQGCLLTKTELWLKRELGFVTPKPTYRTFWANEANRIPAWMYTLGSVIRDRTKLLLILGALLCFYLSASTNLTLLGLGAILFLIACFQNLIAVDKRLQACFVVLLGMILLFGI